MGNLFDEIGNCYTCYDEGVIFGEPDSDGFINDFCPDCEKGQNLESEYALWYAQNEMNENTKERELI